MKTIYLLLLPLLSSSLFSQADEGAFGEIVYNCSRDVEALNRRLKTYKPEHIEFQPKIENDLRSAFAIAEDFQFKLIFNDSVAYSYLYQDAVSEGIKDDFQYKIAKISVRGNHVYVKTSAEKLKFYETSIDDGKSYIHVTEAVNKYNWRLMDEMKTIKGYACKKAICYYTWIDYQHKTMNDTITAWYTPEIPFPYGPMGFDGLPGLVLEVNDGRVVSTTYAATNIHVLPRKKKLVSILNEPSETLTAEELERRMSVKNRMFGKN